MLDLVKCQVLSVLASEHVDAYLLSESSMFVFPHKLILKTCGTTTLLRGLPKMLQFAAQSAGLSGEYVPAVNGCPAPAAPPVATPYRVFYSRKNFLYPDKQRGPHRSWADEVRFLDTMFLGGSAYLVGKMNGEHWYLYITSPDTRLTPPPTPEWERSSASSSPLPQSPVHADDEDAAGAVVALEDETLEVLMTDLDPECVKRFYLHNATALLADPTLRASVRGVISGGPITINGATNGTTKGTANGTATIGSADDGCHSAPPSPSVATDPLSTEGHVLGSLVSKVTGLSEIYPQSQYPDARIDAYLFSPCGFSANGVIPATAAAPTAAPSNGLAVATAASAPGTTHYFTVHVTPEPHCSYASFETNVPSGQSGRATAEVVSHVVDIFRPGRFSVTLFEAKPPSSPSLSSAASKASKNTRVEAVAGYRRVERIVHDLDGYDLVFRYYEREGWKGGAPRLGEKSAVFE